MKRTKILLLVLFLYPVRPAVSDVDLLLLPREPVDMSLSPNPDVPTTRITAVPSLSLSDIGGSEGLGELWSDMSGSDLAATLGESLPLAALRIAVEGGAPTMQELEVLRLTAVVGGLVNIETGSPTSYLVRADVYLSSPAFDRKFNYYDFDVGNGLVLSAGYMGKGSSFDSEVFWKDPTGALTEGFVTFHGYALGRAPWTSQFVVLDVGFNSPVSGDSDPYLDVSASMSFPVRRGGRSRLYVSGYLAAPRWDYISTVIGQAGVMIPGEVTGRSVALYAEIETRYEDPDRPTHHGRMGAKLNL